MAAVNRFSRINLTIQQLCLTVCTRGTIILWRRVCFHVGGDLGFCLIVTSVWQRRMCACVSLYPCYWVFGWRSCACANKRNVFRLTLNSFTLFYIYIFFILFTEWGYFSASSPYPTFIKSIFQHFPFSTTLIRTTTLFALSTKGFGTDQIERSIPELLPTTPVGYLVISELYSFRGLFFSSSLLRPYFSSNFSFGISWGITRREKKVRFLSSFF